MRTAKIDFMLKSVIFPLFICSLSLTVWADETIEIPPIPNTIKINESLKGVSADCLTTKEVPVNADDIKLCYKKHFLFIELLMMTSDSDFESVDKKQERQIKIKKEIENHSASMSLCYSQLLTYSKKDGDQKNIQYVAKRLSEIGDLLN